MMPRDKKELCSELALGSLCGCLAWSGPVTFAVVVEGGRRAEGGRRSREVQQ